MYSTLISPAWANMQFQPASTPGSQSFSQALNKISKCRGNITFQPASILAAGPSHRSWKNVYTRMGCVGLKTCLLSLRLWLQQYTLALAAMLLHLALEVELP